jgi:hypothetical protein
VVQVVLYLGNISFGALDDKDRAAVFGKGALTHVATLLGLDPDSLRKMLTNTVNMVRGEEMIRPLKPSQAEDIRDGAAKVWRRCVAQCHRAWNVLGTYSASLFRLDLRIFGFCPTLRTSLTG